MQTTTKITAITSKNCRNYNNGLCTCNDSVPCEPANSELNCRYLDKLWQRIKYQKWMCNEANHRLMMAYAEHKEGEPYTKCDELLNKCTAILDKLNTLTEEYNLLTWGSYDEKH